MAGRQEHGASKAIELAIGAGLLPQPPGRQLDPARPQFLDPVLRVCASSTKLVILRLLLCVSAGSRRTAPETRMLARNPK